MKFLTIMRNWNWNSTVVQNIGPGEKSTSNRYGSGRIRIPNTAQSKDNSEMYPGTVLTVDLYSNLDMSITFVAIARTSDATQISVKASRSLFLTDSHGQTEKDNVKKLIQLLLYLELRIRY